MMKKNYKWSFTPFILTNVMLYRPPESGRSNQVSIVPYFKITVRSVMISGEKRIWIISILAENGTSYGTEYALKYKIHRQFCYCNNCNQRYKENFCPQLIGLVVVIKLKIRISTFNIVQK